MRQKVLTVALSALVASTMLFSCQSVEEPIPTFREVADDDMVEYTISVNVPEEMRTRAAEKATIGENGLYEFPTPDILQLACWYLYDGNQRQNTTLYRSNNSEAFQYSFYLSKDDDPSKIELVFVAKNDNSLQYNQNINDLVSTFPTLNGVSGSKDELKFSACDAFYGRFKLSETNDKSNRNLSYTLKRPFAEFHVLCDDLLPETSELYKDYPKGITTVAGFGSASDINSSNITSNFKYLYSYNFDTKKQTFANFSSNFYYFINDLNDSSKKVIFKERNFHYLTCFYMLAPEEKSKLTDHETTLDKLNIIVYNNNKTLPSSLSEFLSSTSKIISIPLPEDGIQANTKYIIYNKSINDGGTGWLDGKWKYEISIKEDPTWEEPNLEQESDKL